MKSIGKADTHVRINFIKGINVSNREQRDRAHYLQAILSHMTNEGQDHTQKC